MIDNRKGALGLLFLLVTAAIMFYYSQESCQVGYFSCSVRGKCIPQEQVCDGQKHCPNNEDEDPVLCAEQYGEMNVSDRYINITLTSNWEVHKKVNECDIAEIPRGCRCKYSIRLFCQDFGLHFMPQNTSSSVTHMILADKSIHELPVETFNPYPHVVVIQQEKKRRFLVDCNSNMYTWHLEGNSLTYIPPNIFRNQLNLTKVFLMHNNLTCISKGVFGGLSKLQWLFLDYNNLDCIYLNDFKDLVSIEWITLSHNRLTFLWDIFPPMPNLFELFIDNNEMTIVRRITFERLTAVQLLSLRNNKIETIEEQAFFNLKNLRELDLQGNNIQILHPSLFASLNNLNRMYIGYNPFSIIPSNIFANLRKLAHLNIKGVEIRNIHISMFSDLKSLQSIVFKKYSYCLYVRSVQRCRPLSDGISSNSQLLYKPVFRYTNWIICFATCAGNIMVLFGRYLFRDENKVLSLIIKNLAVSDLLMGIYLLLIGIQDMRYRNIYYLEAHNWISSWGCTITGIIAMLSSEVSVLILVFMSVDRFLLIAMPFGKYSALTMRETVLALIFIWSLGFIVAVFPALEYLSSTRFYGVNGLCFPLHIDDPYLIGWQYSAVIFFGINATSLIIIASVYTVMFISIWRTRNATTLPAKDYQFAVRFFFIVLTDICCWLPIITVKAAAIMGATISADLYGWLVVFILPINSALNPILYTFTTPKYRTTIMKKVPSLIKEVASMSKNNGNKIYKDDIDNLKLACGNGATLNPNNVKIVVNKF